jgi:16S rRNA processing protein RimM
MSLDADYVVIGKVGKTYGVFGWLKIISFSDAPTDIMKYDPWYLEDNKTWKLVTLDDKPRAHGKGVIAKFAGYDTPEHARVLTGKEIAIRREQRAKLKKNEYYWSDLEGLTVINQHDTNDVFVVKGDKEHAIPYLLGDVVISIDLDTRIMRVNWEEL